MVSFQSATVRFSLSFILLGSAAFGGLRLHPALEAELAKLKIGELASISKRDGVIGFTNRDARQDYLKATSANDKEGVTELLAADKISLLESGTMVRILEHDATELERFMAHVHRMVDFDIQAYKDCLGRNATLAAARLSPRPCDEGNLNLWYDRRLASALDGSSVKDVVASKTLVLVRAMDGKNPGKKYWLPFGSLSTPSKATKEN